MSDWRPSDPCRENTPPPPLSSSDSFFARRVDCIRPRLMEVNYPGLENRKLIPRDFMRPAAHDHDRGDEDGGGFDYLSFEGTLEECKQFWRARTSMHTFSVHHLRDTSEIRVYSGGRVLGTIQHSWRSGMARTTWSVRS